MKRKMKGLLSFAVVLLLLSSTAFAAIIEDWSNVNPSRNIGTFADTMGSKISFTIENGPNGNKTIKLTSTMIVNGWCGIWRAVAADLSKNNSLKFKTRSNAAGEAQIALKDSYNVQYVAIFQVSSGDWTEVTVPFSSFNKDPYYTPPDAIPGHPMDLTMTKNMNFAPKIIGDSVVEIGPIEAVGTAAEGGAQAAPETGASSVLKEQGKADELSGFNWIKNGDFKSAGNWTGTLVTKPGMNGEPAAFLENTNPAWTMLAQSVNLPQPSPPAMEVSGWMKCDNIVQGRHDWEKCRIMVTFFNVKGAQVGGWPEDLAQGLGSKDWALYTRQYSVPAGAAMASVQLVLGNCTGSGWFSGLKMQVYDYDMKLLPAGTRQTHAGRKASEKYRTGNWLFNPDFETPGSYDWQFAGVATEGRQSLHSLYSENAPPSWNLASQDVSFNGTHPAAVVYSGWIRTDGVVQGSDALDAARLGIYFRDGQDRQLNGWQDAAALVTGTTGWTHYEKRYDVPTGAASAHVTAGMGGASGKAWFDDLSFTLLDRDGKKMEDTRVGRQTTDTSDWYAFQPPAEASDAPVDLSFLNDAPAGKHGFVTAKDGHFIFSDGTAARFWGVVLVGGAIFVPHDEADQLAERMARMGVNMVRLHFLDNDWGESLFDPNADNTQVFNPAALDKMDYLIAALKKRGIYVYPDWLVGRKFRKGDQIPGSDGLEPGAKTVIHFSHRVIELNKKYAEMLLSHVNPYTGLALKDDPVYVGNEIVNESSIFSGFWEQKFPQPFWDELQAQYQAWGGHGDITRFRFDWDDQKIKPILHPENEAESLRFLLQTVVKSNLEMKDFLKALSPHALLSGSNMGMPVLGNTYGDSVMDFMDGHGYWDYPQYEVTAAGWSDAEHAPMYNDSQLLKPFKPYEGPPLLRLSHDAVEGKPFICTEWNYCYPNEYRIEGPVLMAAYGSLQGWDGMLQHNWSPLWIGRQRMTNLDINGRPDNESLFIAGALIFRLGYLKPAPVTVVELLSDEAVLKNGMKSEWFYGHPWIPYVAKVAKRFTGKNEEPAADLSVVEKYYNRVDKVLNSATGELTLDYGKGVLKIDSPKAQGFAGAIGTGKKLKTSGLSLTLAKRNPWAAVLAVSLDQKPLSESGRFMVFAQARAENSGQVFNGTRTALKSAGRTPILMQGVKGEVSIAVNPALKYRVVPVDESGKKGRPLKASLTQGTLQFNLSPVDRTAYYLVVTGP
jgi:hypothetical protein